ncbi:MAG: ComF family protein [bacterium]|nr:ComF family protein [bacterium]
MPSCKCRNSFTIGAASIYSKGPIHELISALKYHGVTKAAEPLGKLVATFIEQTKFDFSNYIIVPIPLSSRRLRERGYNQAELITKEFLMYFPDYSQNLQNNIIKRIVNSDPQTSMGSRELRKDNIIGAFSVMNSSAIQGKRILLIDDVYTTGATSQEVAKVLKESGARRVIILTVARA